MFNMKKFLSLGLVGALLVGGTLAADVPNAEAKKKKQEVKQEVKANQEEGYLFKSALYNYSIRCPQKPLGSIPAKMFFEDNSKKGDVIIFETEGGDIYKVKHAWVVLLDAFDDASIPDLNKISEEDALELLKKIDKNNGYAAIALVPISKTNNGIYAVTSKEIEIDTDNDGTPDAVATSDRQLAVTFFRGSFGGRFCVQLIDNPDLRTASVEAYKYGVSTLQENELSW